MLPSSESCREIHRRNTLLLSSGRFLFISKNSAIFLSGWSLDLYMILILRGMLEPGMTLPLCRSLKWSPMGVSCVPFSMSRTLGSIMNVSRTRFTHSRQNGTLAESRSEEGSLTGSSAQPDTWRIPHSSPPFQPGTHTDRAITARGEGPRPAACQCRVGMGGGGGRPLEGFASNWTRATIKKRACCSSRDNAVDNWR